MIRRKRFFTNKLIDTIITKILSECSTTDITKQDLNFLKTISKGDLSMLPSPADIKNKDFSLQYFPALYIYPEITHNTIANGNKSISSKEHSFIMRYMEYINMDDTSNVVANCIDRSDLIASFLEEDDSWKSSTNSRTNINGLLENPSGFTEIFGSDGSLIGQILETSVPKILYDTVETQAFKELEIPIVLVELNFVLSFRTVYKK